MTTPRNAATSASGLPPFKPSERDLARERCVDMWRGRVMFATSKVQRRIAMEEIERLRAERPLAMVEWMQAGGWAL